MRSLLFSGLILLCAFFGLAVTSTYAHDFKICDDCGWGECCFQYTGYCNARPLHPNPACQAGHVNTDCGCSFISGCGCVVSYYCRADIAPGTLPELPNGIDDDCDGYVDDEQCDGVDNDGDGSIDEDLGSCLARLLYVPLGWQGSQSEFEQTADAQWGIFQHDVVPTCPDNFWHHKLKVANDNIQISSSICNGFADIENYIRNTYGNQFFLDFNAIFALTDQDICGNTAGLNGGSIMWIETGDDSVLAHEYGHAWDLEDEYCSNRAGSRDERCNDGGIPADYNGDGVTPAADVNPLRSNLGCDPMSGQGCCSGCTSVDYGICCDGNENSWDGRCIMSYADADGPRHFCNACLTSLQGVINCSQAFAGAQPVMTLTYSITEDGKISLKTTPIIGKGRLGIGSSGTQGSYALEIYDSSGNLLYREAKDIDFGYDGPMYSGVDYSGIRYTERTFALRAPLPASAQGPLKVTALKDGVATSQTCLTPTTTPGGIIELSVDTVPPAMSCPSNISLECSESGGCSASSSTLRAFLSYAEQNTTDNCDPTPKVTNDAHSLFPLGETTVTFTATDAAGNSSECTAVVAVHDTTPPVLSGVPADITVQCDAVPTPATVTATDKCDTNVDPSFNQTRVDGNCASNYTLTRTWTATDDSENMSRSSQTITVQDTVGPVICCNNPATMTPSQVPMSFTATASDNCSTSTVQITGFSCYSVKNGVKSRNTSCVVNVVGNQINILNSGGVGDNIAWTVRATDGCANSSDKECSIKVVNPKK